MTLVLQRIIYHHTDSHAWSVKVKGYSYTYTSKDKQRNIGYYKSIYTYRINRKPKVKGLVLDIYTRTINFNTCLDDTHADVKVNSN